MDIGFMSLGVKLTGKKTVQLYQYSYHVARKDTPVRLVEHGKHMPSLPAGKVVRVFEILPSSLDDISAYQHHCSKTRTVNVKNKKIENDTNMSNPLSCIVDSIVDTLSLNMPASSGASKRRTLKVSGLGHSITLETEPSDTIGDLKQEIESQTSIPAIYQRLLARGKKLEDDTLLLEEAGLEHRTKVMLLHNPSYVQEKEGYETLSRLAKDIDDLESKKDETPNKLMSEFVTRICCKLDAVEIKGSEDLRAFRKTLLRKAQGIDSAQ
jgi:hypothetical protein